MFCACLSTFLNLLGEAIKHALTDGEGLGLRCQIAFESTEQQFAFAHSL
jgi:hypothetical protein